MKIISAAAISEDRRDRLDNLLKHIGTGIVLLGEASFEQDESERFNIPREIEVTRSYPISLIGTQNDIKGSSTVYIIKKGEMSPAQKSLFDYDYARDDLLYDVSPTNVPVKALIRICAEGADEYHGGERADLLLIPQAMWLGDNCRNIGIPELIEIHRSSLKGTALIVTADQQYGEPIYDLRGKIVSKLRNYGKFEYHEADLKIE